jgi:hypothetical protein
VSTQKGPGAPKKYTPARVKIILDCIGRGLSQNAAAKAARIAPKTLNRWLKLYPEFKEGVERAQVQREKHLVAIVEEGAEKDWRAAKFLLECRHQGWSRDSKTTQDNRDLMDRLKIMEQALSVKLHAIKVQQVSMSNDDYDIIEILNEVHGIEEKFDGEEILLKNEQSEVSSSDGDGAIPNQEEVAQLH